MSAYQAGRITVIDGQILQTPALDRGMGKYTLSLLKAFVRQQEQYDQIEVILSLNLITDKKRMNFIKKFTGVDQLTFLDLPTDIAKDCMAKHKRAEEVISEYVEETYKDKASIDFLITSPFFVEFPTAFPRQGSARKFVLAYDLIPQKIWHLQRIFPDDIYFSHFRLYIQADRIFTISHAVKGDLTELVGVNPEKIVPIDGGPFEKVATKDMEKLELKNPFIIYPSAPIIHKNNERAVRAFERFNKSHGNRYTLYVTSTFDDETRSKLQKLSKNIIFTGNISDQALAYAYSKADVLFFPSLSEGLGMPVLEALQYGVPVACSNIPVLSELSKKAFYQFDPTNETEMVQALGDATSKVNWQVHKKAADETLAKYTWDRSARLLIDGLCKPDRAAHKLPALQLKLPKPNIHNPAAALGELCYAQLNDRFEQVGIKFTGQGRFTVKPSYVSEQPEEVVKGPILTFSSRRLLTGKKHKIKITLLLESGIKRQMVVSAVKIYADKVLQLNGWRFTDTTGTVLKPQTILRKLFES